MNYADNWEDADTGGGKSNFQNRSNLNNRAVLRKESSDYTKNGILSSHSRSGINISTFCRNNNIKNDNVRNNNLMNNQSGWNSQSGGVKRDNSNLTSPNFEDKNKITENEENDEI